MTEIRTAFQPIFRFEQSRLQPVAYEALARPERDGKDVSPGSFFGQLAETEFTAVETLCRTVHLFNVVRFLPPQPDVFLNFDPRICVNLAAVESAVDDLQRVVDHVGLRAGRIVCEITEGGCQSPDLLKALTRELRERGFLIAVDDYGAFESDIARVKDIAPDIVKFDGALVGRLMETNAGMLLLKTLVAEFADLGARSLFEGIEQPMQIQAAEYCGAEMVQGFVLGWPQTVPADFSRQVVAASTAPTSQSAGHDDAPAAASGSAGKTFGKRLSIP